MTSEERTKRKASSAKYYAANKTKLLAAKRAKPENNRAASRKWYLANTEKECQRSMIKYRNDPAKAKAQTCDWRTRNPERAKAISAKYSKDKGAKWRAARPGYTTRQSNTLKERKAGRPRPELCEVCGLPGRICFDHCHATGKFRGWLCHGCNASLGYARDNPETLIKLSKYLEAAHERNGVIL